METVAKVVVGILVFAFLFKNLVFLAGLLAIVLVISLFK